jgi:phosphatidylserine decarboxylase
MSSAFRESLRILGPLLAGLLFSLLLPGPWAGVVALPLFLGLVFTLYFFRDPERAVPAEAAVIVSAADGVVVGVDQVDEAPQGLGRCQRVAVFLSVFDVHVNRMPVAGRIEKITHTPGKFLDVRLPEAALHNEHQDWLLETEHGPVVVRQIAGLVARRIVAWASEGDSLTKGARFGMIRFGSRTEVYLPLSSNITVKPGDRVKGGLSVIGHWVPQGAS